MGQRTSEEIKGVWSRLGSGELVQVWTDNWILADTIFKLCVSYQSLFLDLRVSDLIDHESRTWNMVAINEFIHPIDIPRITNIDIQVTHN